MFPCCADPGPSTLPVLTPVGGATLADSTVQQAAAEGEEERENQRGRSGDRQTGLSLPSTGERRVSSPFLPLCVSQSTRFENVFVHTQGERRGRKECGGMLEMVLWDSCQTPGKSASWKICMLHPSFQVFVERTGKSSSTGRHSSKRSLCVRRG